MDTITINFKASGQNLTADAHPQRYASNTVNYIQAVFDLDENWQRFDSVRAVWHNDFACISTVLDGDGACTVPHEVLTNLDEVHVNLVGSDVDGEELVDRMTTYPLRVVIIDAHARICGTETAEVTPSQFEQYVAIVRELVADIKDIDSVELNADYTLTISFSDGTETTVGPIRGEQGETGNGIASAVLNDDYTLTLTFTDGTSYTTPSIRGEQGEQGEPGEVTLAQLSAVLPTDTASGAIASFPDGSDLFDYLSCVCDINPLQDLHGYDKPWVGGAGVNKWEPFDGSSRGITFTQQDDGTIKISGTMTLSGWPQISKDFTLAELGLSVGDTIYCYAPTDSDVSAAIRFFDSDSTQLSQISTNSSGTIPANTVTVRLLQIGKGGNNTPQQGDTINTVGKFEFLKGSSAPTAWTPYSNICPITGWTGANVVRTGKNLNPSTGVNYTTSNATRIFCKAGTYTISTNNGASLGSNNQLYIRLFDAQTDGNTITSGNITGSNMQLNSSGTLLYGGNGYASVTVTIAVDCWVALGFNNQVPSNFTGLQMEVGSSATSYEAYSGNTYSIPFGQTVYGGTLDVTTGVLTVDRAIMTPTIDQFTSANSHGITNSRFVISPSCDYATRNTSICNALPIQNTLFADTATEGFLMSGQDVGYIRLLSSRVSTKQEAQDFVNTNGITIVYPLATPTTIQLTPTEVKSLLGSNNIFADCGDSEVTVPNLITVTNKGNTIARPRMTIYGSGNVNVIVNGIQVFSIAMGDIGYITIDGEQMEATQGEGVLKNRLVTGDYSDFVLQSGENIIALTGNVTEVQISNYSRWL